MGEKSGCVGLMEEEKEERDRGEKWLVGLMEEEREKRDGGEERELNCLYYLIVYFILF